MGLTPRSTTVTGEQEAVAAAIRKHPCLWATVDDPFIDPLHTIWPLFDATASFAFQIWTVSGRLRERI